MIGSANLKEVITMKRIIALLLAALLMVSCALADVALRG